jgi:peptidoglycan/LPS O-acetylase OafA/YrhL
VAWRQMHWPLKDYAFFHTGMCLDGILCGSVMALYWRRWKPIIQKTPRITVPVAVLAFFTLDLWSAELQGSAGLIQAMLVCVLMACTISIPGRLASRMLESAAIVWLGRMSYSIYLWQQLFLCPAETPHWQFPLRLIAIGSAAWLSYHLVELPLQAVGRRLLQRGPRAA